MKENRYAALARYRIEKASRNLRIAQQNFQLAQYEEAVSKSYYYILTAMRALIALHHQEARTHEGVITLFQKLFVQPKLFPKEFNRAIKTLRSLRQDADYGDFIEISREQAAQGLRHAAEFLKRAEEVMVRMLTVS